MLYFSQVVRTICSEYPYWFLRVEPGNVFPKSFPISSDDLLGWDRPFSRFLDRGWLLVDSGDDTYSIATTALPGYGDQNSDFWDFVPIQQVNSVKEFDMSGDCVKSLTISRGSRALSNKTYNKEGQPSEVLWETGQSVDYQTFSWLTFNPKPDRTRIYQLDFFLSYPLDFFPIPNNQEVYSNSFIQNYPEVAVAIGMLYYSEWYNDARLMTYWDQKLHGNAQAVTASNREGLIGGMRKDSVRRKDQGTFSVPVYTGGREATGGGNRPYWKGRRSYYQESY